MKKVMSMAMVALFVIAMTGCCCIKGKQCCCKGSTSPEKPAAEKADM